MISFYLLQYICETCLTEIIFRTILISKYSTYRLQIYIRTFQYLVFHSANNYIKIAQLTGTIFFGTSSSRFFEIS